MWVYPTDTGYSSLPKLVIHSYDDNPPTATEWGVFIDYNAFPEQVILQVNSIDISDEVTMDQWNLIICEIDQTLGDFTIQVNNNSKVTGTIDPPTFGYAMPLVITSELIDELFFFSESLTTGDIAEIYNSGTGHTYPF